MKDKTKRQKLQLFQEGRYKMRAPDTCHARWSDLDWVNWIDSNGVWIDTHAAPDSNTLQNED